MDSELARIMQAAKAQYDAEAKDMLAQKIVIANILAGAVTEFQGLTPEEIMPFLEEEMQVAKVAVLPGSTNRTTSVEENGETTPKVASANTEDKVPGEGEITFDVRFCMWTPKNIEQIKLLMDMEAQKDFYPGYDIVTRGIFYAARMISSQHGTEFVKSDYNKIKKVYSIWICMNAPAYAENTITEYCIQQVNRVGNYPKDKNRYDLLSVIVIGLGEKLPIEPNLHRFLGVLFSNVMKVNEKKVLEEEFHIPMTEELQEGVEKMCNLSEAIEERGIERGMEAGIQRGMEAGIQRGMEAGIERGIEAGIQRGIEAGRLDGKIESAVQLVTKMKMSIPDACKVIGITVEEYNRYYR